MKLYSKISIFIFFLLAMNPVFAQLMGDSLLIDGHYRSFHYNLPQKPNANTSLIFILHGSGGSGIGIMKGTAKLEAISTSENILMVYPDGYKHFWNECRKMATSAANVENIDENSFFDQMIDYFVKKYRVNPSKVFVIGTSGGGHMAYKLALTMPEKFKAISAIIANLPDSGYLDCPEKRVPFPVMITNGTSDGVNPYNGGDITISGAFWGKVRSTDQTFHYWADIAGYPGKPKGENLPDIDPGDGKTIEKYSYSEKGKPEVVLLKVINGKHDYPNDIDIYLESWSFFKRQMENR